MHPTLPVIRRWRRLWLLLPATAVPCFFFLGLEVSFRVFGIGQDLSLFIPAAEPGTYQVNSHFTDRFLPVHFDLKPLPARIKKHKDPATLRVFALGESAVFGTPEPGFSFPALLRAQLRSHYPGRNIEVINLGITAINSHVIRCIADELDEFEPDLIVIYMGNNEVVGPYGPGSAFLSNTPPLRFIRASLAVRKTRMGQWLSGILNRLFSEGNRQIEWDGMETFTKNSVRGDDPRLENVYANFTANLRAIVRSAIRSKAKVVLSTVTANLKDNPPFLSLHQESLSATGLADWKSTYDQGILAWKLGKPDQARTYFEKALSMDPQYAECHFLLGKIAEQRGETEAARRHFVSALHWDALRFRPDPRINAAIRQVAREFGDLIILVDAARELGSDVESPAPIAGHEILLEHVHFNWDGNLRLARRIAEAFVQNSDPQSSGQWLDEKGCADAVGYTIGGELIVLSSLGELTSAPPFTGQLDFSQEQTRQKREMSRLRSLLSETDALSKAATTVERAVQNDPENPFLPVRGSEITYMMGDYAQSLRYVEKALSRTPTAYLLHKKGTLLLTQGRLEEAEKTFLQSLELDPYFFPVCTGLEEIWVKTRQIDRGRAFFEALLRQYSWNHFLRVTYSDFLLRVGDTVAAEAQCRSVLAKNPGDSGALERLINILKQTNQTDKILETMQRAFPHQPKNFDNNLRLARHFESLGDYPATVIYLEAATESAPADLAAEMVLAQYLLKLNRHDEMMVHLLKARNAAKFDDDAKALNTINDLISEYGSKKSQ